VNEQTRTHAGNGRQRRGRLGEPHVLPDATATLTIVKTVIGRRPGSARTVASRSPSATCRFDVADAGGSRTRSRRLCLRPGTAERPRRPILTRARMPARLPDARSPQGRRSSLSYRLIVARARPGRSRTRGRARPAGRVPEGRVTVEIRLDPTFDLDHRQVVRDADGNGLQGPDEWAWRRAWRLDDGSTRSPTSPRYHPALTQGRRCPSSTCACPAARRSRTRCGSCGSRRA
jgi:hypothetical protein